MTAISRPDEAAAPVRTSSRSKPSIRSRLLLAVNLPLAAFVAIFLCYDYSREMSQRLEDKRIALEEEAKTLLPAVLQMRHHGRSGVQGYIDTVCGGMRDVQSPGHHIAIELEGETFQATTHDRASPEMLLAIQSAARSSSHLASFHGTELVVGFHDRDGATVYVSESLDHVRDSVVGDVLRRLFGLVAMAVVAMAVVNVFLSRVVSAPLGQLVHTVQRIGKGELGVQARSFGTAELDYLAKQVNAMSSSLAATDRVRRAQMEKAREIQRNLLPGRIDAREFEVAHMFKPADDVGGDYFDVLPLEDGSWLFCVADVTGHGVPAAMTASMLKTLLLQAAETLTSPDEMMTFVNKRCIAASPFGDFVTMILVRVAAGARRMEYASAGHEPAFLLSHGDECRELWSTGTILGFDADTTWTSESIELEAGDRLLMTTDGVSETHDSKGGMFGRERLGRMFVESRRLAIDDVLTGVDESLRACRGAAPQRDDVTCLLVEFSRGG